MIWKPDASMEAQLFFTFIKEHKLINFLSFSNKEIYAEVWLLKKTFTSAISEAKLVLAPLLWGQMRISMKGSCPLIRVTSFPPGQKLSWDIAMEVPIKEIESPISMKMSPYTTGELQIWKLILIGSSLIIIFLKLLKS